MEFNVKSIAMTAIVTAISALMVATLLVPVVSSAQYSLTEEENNASYQYSSASAEGFSLENVSGGTNLINGVSTVHTGGTNWVFSDYVQIRIGADNRTSYICPEYANTLNAGDKIVFENNTVTITTAAYSGTYEYTHLYVPDASGDYGAFFGQNFHVNNGTPMFIVSLGFPAGAVNFTGTYSYTEGWNQIKAPTTTVAAGAAIPLNKSVEFEINVVEDKISYGIFPATAPFSWKYVEDGEDDVIGTASAQIFAIAPLTYNTLEESSSPLFTVIGVVPIIVLAGLVIGVVGTFIRNRD